MNSRTFIAAIFLATTTTTRAADKLDFAHDVLPLLKKHCAKCHTNGTYKGNLSLDTRESLLMSKAVVPGKSGESELIHRVTSQDPEVRMPLEAKPLTEKEVAVLRQWIDAGVPWQEGFSFKAAPPTRPLKLRMVELPPARNGRTHPVDRCIDAYYSRQKIEPPAPVDDAQFLRRVTLDLIGLLPTPEEMERFVASTDQDKRQRWIDELLSRDRQYAEHWLTFWNDLLRNDYAGTGYIDGGRKQITGWLYPALVENKPYDQFVRELIAPSPESEGFINGIKWRGRVNASQVREIQFAQSVAQVFLGLNLKCASCHDSFIDDWKLADSYGLAAVISDRPLEIHRCDKPTGEIAQAAFLYPELGRVDPALPRSKRLEQLAGLMTHTDNGRLPRTIVNRLWQRLMGRGIVHPVDIMANKAWDEDLLDFLAAHLVENNYDLKETIELIVTSQAYQSESTTFSPESPPESYAFRGPLIKRMTAEEFVDAVWRLTGTAPGKPAVDVGDRDGEPVRASLVVSNLLMRSLGRPNREQVVTTRPDELTTLQALDLTNGEELFNLLARGATQLKRRHPDWTGEQWIDWLYRSALCRPAEAEERRIVLEIAGTQPTADSLADLLWAVLMLPEFQLIQ